MHIISGQGNIHTIECCAIFRHYIGWGNVVICPHCNAKGDIDTLKKEFEEGRAGEKSE